jgi:hypothetical protein
VGSVRIACSRCDGQRNDDDDDDDDTTATGDTGDAPRVSSAAAGRGVTWSVVIEPTYHRLLIAGEDDDELATLIGKLEAAGATGYMMMPYDAPRAVPLSGRRDGRNAARTSRATRKRFPWRENGGGWHGGASLGWEGKPETCFTAGALVARAADDDKHPGASPSGCGILTAGHCVEGVDRDTHLVSPCSRDSAGVQTRIAPSDVQVSKSWGAAVVWLSDKDAAEVRSRSPRGSCESRRGLPDVLFDAFSIKDGDDPDNDDLDPDMDDLERHLRLDACTKSYTFSDTLPPHKVEGRSGNLHLVGIGRTTEAVHLETPGTRVAVRISIPADDDVIGAQVSLGSPTREFRDMIEMKATKDGSVNFPAKGDSGTVLYTLEEKTFPTICTTDKVMAGLHAAAVLTMRSEIPFVNICYGAPLSLRPAESREDRGVLESMGIVLHPRD